jgi:hypothetical protein
MGPGFVLELPGFGLAYAEASAEVYASLRGTAPATQMAGKPSKQMAGKDSGFGDKKELFVR